jgi:hypothetical protein
VVRLVLEAEVRAINLFSCCCRRGQSLLSAFYVFQAPAAGMARV